MLNKGAVTYQPDRHLEIVKHLVEKHDLEGPSNVHCLYNYDGEPIGYSCFGVRSRISDRPMWFYGGSVLENLREIDSQNNSKK